jgi:hypothetical protein
MKTIPFKLHMLMLSVVLLFNSCYKENHCITGNGSPEIETRALRTFAAVVNNGDFEVHILPADFHEVVVDAESNLLPYIRTTVSGGRLHIETEGNRCINNTMTIIITVYTPYVDELVLNGSGFIGVEDLYLDELYLQLNGSGEIEAEGDILQLNAAISGSGLINLEGIAETTDFNISGSGQIRSYNLLQEDCYATISGSGNMYVRPSRLLDVVISGSGNVYYKGNPVVNQRITGSGRVIRQ